MSSQTRRRDGHSIRVRPPWPTRGRHGRIDRDRQRDRARARRARAPRGRDLQDRSGRRRAAPSARVREHGVDCVLVEGDTGDPRRSTGSASLRWSGSAGSTSGSTTPRGCSSSRCWRRPTRSGTACWPPTSTATSTAAARRAARWSRGGSGGRIINVSSAADILVVADLGAYIAAKGAIVAMTKVLALELADARHHRQRDLPGRDRHAVEQGRLHAGGAARATRSGSACTGSARRRRSPTRRCSWRATPRAT